MQRLERRLLLNGDWLQLSSSTGDLPVPAGNTGQSAALVVDVDRDGVNDFVLASWDSSETVAWYRRSESGWEKFLIDGGSEFFEAGGAVHDVDGDGDQDVVFGEAFNGDQIFWWENPYPTFDPQTPWTRHVIRDSGSNKYHDMGFADVDGDGDAEFVTFNQNANRILMFEIPSDPRTSGPWSASTIYTWSSGEQEGLVFDDVNLDGKVDIIGAGRWLEHTGGTNFTAHVLAPSQTFVRAAAGQLVAGGRPELVFVPGDADGPLTWHQWNEASESWDSQTLLSDVTHGHSLDVADINDDGHLDIFVGEMGRWGGGSNPDAEISVFYGDSTGNFTREIVLTGQGVHEGRVADLDGDGDLDILVKPFRHNAPRIDVLINELNPVLPLDDWQRHEIDADLPWRSIFVDSADVDDDGLTDVLAGGWWYQNPVALDGAWQRTAVGAPLNNVAAVFDFDGDGDADVLGTEGVGSQSNSDFVWARNDGAGGFTILNNIDSASGDFLQGVAVDRFGPNGTGPLEVALSWHNGGGGVQMLTVGADSSVDQWTWRTISPTTQSEQLSSGDIDGDGDSDLLLGTRWLRNDQTAWTPLTLNPTSDDPDRNRLADINGDGRLDAVIGFEAISAPGKLAWYEQPTSSAEDTWTEYVIATITGPMSVDVRDMDGDGDLDVVAGEHNLADPSSARMFVFENADGDGTDWVQHLVSTGDEHHDGAHVTDIDGDGDFDIVSIGWQNDKVVLYENRAIVQGAPTVATPAISPDGGVFTEPVEVTLSTATAGAALHYTLDGSTPTQASTLYSGPFTLTDSATVRVRAFRDGFNASPISSADFTVFDGQGDRVVEDLVTLYTFDEGSGSTIFDESGVGSPLNLIINDPSDVTWHADGSLGVDASTLIATSGAATKLIGAMSASHAITIEAWLTPASTSQNGPARIVSLSADPFERNFTLGQGVFGETGDRYEARLRTTATSDNGTPALQSPSGSLNGALQHVVYTRDAAGNATIFIDGQLITGGAVGGDLSNWDTTMRLALANELTGDRPWLGTLHLVAIYDDALTQQEVAQNYVAGPEPTTVNQPPVATDDTATVAQDSSENIIDVLANDTDPDPGDTVTIFAVTQPANGTVNTDGLNVTYTPNAGFVGQDSFTYLISDNDGLVDEATVVVSVADLTPPTVMSVSINGGDAQRSIVTRLDYQFSEHVTATGDAIALLNLNTGEPIAAGDISFAYDDQTFTATWAFPGLSGETLPDGNYVATLDASLVIDAAGNALDGDGHQSAGGDHDLEFFRYFGDFDGDRDADFSDLFVYRAAHQSTSEDANYDRRADSDADGDVDAIDLFAFRARYQLVLDPVVQTDNALQVLEPGDGWLSATAQPDSVGDPSDTGFDAKAIARWDVVPYQTFEGLFEIGVVAFHMNGIDRVEFAVDGGEWLAVTEVTPNPRTEVEEYWVSLDASEFDHDGVIEVRAIVFPTIGIPRVLAGEFDELNSLYGSQWTGEHSLVLYTNANGSLVEEVIELPAGEYTWAQSLLAGVQQLRDRWLTIRPAPGVDRSEVVISNGLQTGNDPIDFRRVRIKDITVQSSGIAIFRHLQDSNVWFDGIHYVGPGQQVPSQAEQLGDYWTNCLVSDNQFGLGRRFVRDCRFERIGEDVMKAVYLVINVEVDDVDRGGNDWHPGVIANPIEHDNRIYYGLTMTNLKGVKGWAFRQGTLGPYEHTDVAIVNSDSEKTGGNQLWYLGGTVNHMYVLNSRFVGGFNYRLSMSVREEWRFKGHNVVFENVNWQDDPAWIPTPYPLEGVTIRFNTVE